MPFKVLFHDDFAPEFNELPDAVQDEILAMARLLEVFGSILGRPHCDTLKAVKLQISRSCA